MFFSHKGIEPFFLFLNLGIKLILASFRYREIWRERMMIARVKYYLI